MTKLDAIRGQLGRGCQRTGPHQHCGTEMSEGDVAWLVEMVNLLKLALAHQRYRNHEFKGSCDGCRLNADALGRLEEPDGL